MPASRTSSTRSSARSSPSVRPRPRTPYSSRGHRGRPQRTSHPTPGEYTRRDRDGTDSTRPSRDRAALHRPHPRRLGRRRRRRHSVSIPEYARAMRRYDGNYAVRSTHSYIAHLEHRLRNLESNLSARSTGGRRPKRYARTSRRNSTTSYNSAHDAKARERAAGPTTPIVARARRLPRGVVPTPAQRRAQTRHEVDGRQHGPAVRRRMSLERGVMPWTAIGLIPISSFFRDT